MAIGEEFYVAAWRLRLRVTLIIGPTAQSLLLSLMSLDNLDIREFDTDQGRMVRK